MEVSINEENVTLTLSNEDLNKEYVKIWLGKESITVKVDELSAMINVFIKQ
jgi:hypothetical protein